MDQNLKTFCTGIRILLEQFDNLTIREIYFLNFSDQKKYITAEFFKKLNRNLLSLL